MFCDEHAVQPVFNECWFDVLTVVKPGGVTCPVPEFSGVSVKR